MRILIDGEHCPSGIKNLCHRLGELHHIEVLLLNPIDSLDDVDDGVLKRTVLEPGTINKKLLEMAGLHDLVVTSHIPLAKKIVDKVTAVLHPDGYIMNLAGIDYLLYERHLEIEDRKQGIAKGLKKRKEKDNQTFENLLLNYISGINLKL
ncbi:MAG: hypothetical protein GX127_04540 [Eubacteriaceae bacterium]|jgi:uncharacterized protein YaiI (UPF0178 family)|nr:hypothetical protein [Eubacteriaceae bacterium]